MLFFFKKKIKSTIREALLASGLFDKDWYCAAYNFHHPEKALDYYLAKGWKKNQDPSLYFSTSFYIEEYTDVRSSKICPLVHFIEHGALEGRSTSPLFLIQDMNVYSGHRRRGKHPILDIAGNSHSNLQAISLFDPQHINIQRVHQTTALNDDKTADEPLTLYDYLTKKELYLLDPHPLFSAHYYMSATSEHDVGASNPLWHYAVHGARQGKNPHPLFDSAFYISQIPNWSDQLIQDPLLHYLMYGAQAGLYPNPTFDGNYYLSTYADARESGLNPLVHYILHGASQEHLTRCPIITGPLPSQPTSIKRSRRRQTSIMAKPAKNPATFVRHVTSLAEAAKKRGDFAHLPVTHGVPLISFIVPIYNTKTAYLNDLLHSFHQQAKGLAELILSDDGSSTPSTVNWLKEHEQDPFVQVIFNPKNKGIAGATNAGLAVAQGKWIGFLDHDDALATFAVEQIAGTLAKHPECQFLYTDEVIADSKLRPIDIFLKPAFDRVLLSGVNYINHLSLYRRERLQSIQGLQEGFEGSQDYDLLLRYTADLTPEQTLHLPYPAYIWRRDGVSYSAKHLASSVQNARRSLAESYSKGTETLQIGPALSDDLHRIRFDKSINGWPMVSVVIPNRDSLRLISQVLEGLTQLTDYPAIEIFVIDNGTKDDKVLALYEAYSSGPVSFHAEIKEEPFNFSRAINRGIAMAKGEYILMLNNDIEILEPNWLKEMVSCFTYEGTGIVGAKLLYPNQTLQHVGVIAGLGIAPGIGPLVAHWFLGKPDNFPGPMGRLRVRQSLSIVTGACLLISRECLNRIGDLDEEIFPIAYNDVDLCLRAVKAQFQVIWTPFAKLVHHESASRGSDERPENLERFRRDQRHLRDRYDTDLYIDRAFNPWYSRDRSEPVAVLLENLPEAR